MNVFAEIEAGQAVAVSLTDTVPPSCTELVRCKVGVFGDGTWPEYSKKNVL